MRKGVRGVLSIAVAAALLVGAGAATGQTKRSERRVELEPVLQLPELPQGCEVTALTMVLLFYGLDVDKMALSDEYLPKVVVGDGADPEKAYLGDPKGEGWYCFTGPIMEAADAYLAEGGTPLRVEDRSGMVEKELKRSLDEGVPVIMWVTIEYERPAYAEDVRWRLNGAAYTPYANLHCVVVYGYDHGYYYVADPLEGLAMVEQGTLWAAFEWMDSRAVVVQ